MFLILCTHADKEGRCWPFLSKIATEEGITTRAVQKWRKELEAFGYLTTERVPGRSNRYQVNRDGVSMLIPTNDGSPSPERKFTTMGAKLRSPKQNHLKQKNENTTTSQAAGIGAQIGQASEDGERPLARQGELTEKDYHILVDRLGGGSVGWGKLAKMSNEEMRALL